MTTSMDVLWENGALGTDMWKCPHPSYIGTRHPDRKWLFGAILCLPLFVLHLNDVISVVVTIRFFFFVVILCHFFIVVSDLFFFFTFHFVPLWSLCSHVCVMCLVYLTASFCQWTLFSGANDQCSRTCTLEMKKGYLTLKDFTPKHLVEKKINLYKVQSEMQIWFS